MKKVLLGIFCIIAATVFFAYSTQDAHSYSSGPPAGRTGSPGDGANCASSCHTGGSNPISGSANAAITSTIPSTGYIPGQTYTVTGTVSGVGLVRFGFQISPQNVAGTQRGTNVITDPTNTQLVGGNKYVEHTSSGNSGSGSRVWTFNWVAPAAGTGAFNFYGAFNAANNSGDNQGDIIYLEQLPIVEAARINTQPANQSACTGANASFSIAATGTSITYQWKKNGATLSNDGHYGGVTTNTLSITSVNAGDVDSYTCEVTGSGNTVASNPATFTLLTPASISDDPDPVNICAGQMAIFTITAAGSNITYQWKRNGTNVTNSGTIFGATTNMLTITNVSAANAGTYTCQVSNTCATPTSAGALLTVNDVTAINTHPTTPQTLCAGATLNLSVIAAGANLSYQWKRGVTNVGTNSPNLQITNTTSGDAGNYTCVVTGTCGTVTSNASVVTINVGPSISADPVGLTRCEGQTAIFNVTAAGTNITYQWKRNNVNLPEAGNFSGTQTAQLTVSNLVSANAGNYTCQVSSTGCGVVTSAIAALTVNTNTVINTLPVGAALCTGDTYTIEMDVSGTNLHYSWKRDNITLPNTDQFIYVIQNAQNGDAGTYTCDITGACGNLTSNPVVISINPNTAINTQPTATQTLCAGATINLSVTAVGANLSYQWKRGNTNVGTNSASLSIPNATVNDAGTYTVIITGACGTVTSANAVVNITPTTAITTQPVSQSGCSGTNITFTVVAAGGNLSYQWRKGVTPVGTNSPNFTINSITGADAASYTVEVTGTCGSLVTSNVATLSVVNSASISQQPTNQQVCLGGPLTLNVIGDGGNNTTYQWRRNTNNVGSSSPTYSVPVTTANDLGTYDVVITGSCGTITSSLVTVTGLDATVVNNLATNNARCEGEDLTLTVSADGANLTYQWELNGEELDGETGSTISLTDVDTSNIGIYSVTVTGTCGTVTSAVIGDLSITEPPVVTSMSIPLPICQGSAIQYILGASGDDLHFQWFRNGTVIANATDPAYNEDFPVNGDVFSCSIWNDCDSINHAFQAVVVNALPFPVIDQQVGNTLITGTFVSYQWLVDGNLVNNSNTPSIITTLEGDYQVIVTDANGCSDTSAIYHFIPDAITENTLSGVSVYPNPSTGDVYFTTPVNMGTFNVQIVSTTGQLVMDKTVENKQLNIAQLPSGLYTVLVTYQGKVARVRLSKE